MRRSTGWLNSYVRRSRVASRVAVVCGAGGGIGGECAARLAATRSMVLCVDREQKAAEATAQRIHEASGRAEIVVADAAEETFAATIAAAIQNADSVDAVVYALAHEEHTSAMDVSRESIERSLALGPVTAFCVFRELLVTGRLVEGAALTAIGSLHAELPFRDCLGYNAAHGALKQVVKTLAHEWARHHIRVNAVVPGWIRTPGESRFYDDAQLNEAGRRLPFGRFGSEADIAAAVDYLSSPAAAYVSGSFLTVDGALAVSLARLDSEV